MKLGSPVWTLCEFPPYADAVKEIANLGFAAVELIAWTKRDLDQYFTNRKNKELRELAGSENLEISQFVSTPPDLASLDKGRREKAIQHFSRAVEVASELNTKIINTVSHWPFEVKMPELWERPMTHTFGVRIPFNVKWETIWQNYVETMDKCADIAEQAGLRYALEPHPFCIVSNADSVLRLLDRIHSKGIGINFDITHFFAVGDLPQPTILKLKDHILHCHFSDNNGTANMHWRPGKGKIDWMGTMKALKEIGYDGVISLEIEASWRWRLLFAGAGDSFPHASSNQKLELYGQSRKNDSKEHVLAKEYIENIAHHLGMKLDRS